MSELIATRARVEAAFAQPTLKLLHKSGPVTVTLLRACFSRQTATIETTRLHQLVANHLMDLRADGATVPDLSGRDLCQRWVKANWLARVHDEEGGEVYTLTSQAQTALTLVDSLESERPTLSEHRISTIVDAARRFNANANPSRSARMQILNDRIAAAEAERNRLEAGGELEPVSADYMLQGFADLLSLISQLPTDFKRVAESFESIRASILDAFRNEEYAAGNVVDAYLRQADDLTTKLPEGRAFQGALDLIRNTQLLNQLREDLQALLEHPQAEAILAEVDKSELRATVAVVHQGLEDVMAQRARATKAIKEYIATHNVARDLQLDQTLRQLDQEFGPWLARTGTRTRVPVSLLPETLDIDYLPRRFHDPADSAPPAPLPEHADTTHDGAEPDLMDLLAWGGPSLDALAAALAAAASGAQEPVGLADVFNALDPALRRPVDVIGMVHLAGTGWADDAPDDARSAPDQIERFEAVRPDGSTRVFLSTRTTLTPTTGIEDQ